MSFRSDIEWTESTWNPVTGCSRISPGCRNCYAERMARRLQLMGQPNYRNGFEVATHEKALQIPLKWKKPQMIFVNSMSDLFHEKVPDSFIHKVFEIMREAHWHRFQVLTKRAERMESFSDRVEWPVNVWLGVSVETQKYLYRLDHLRRTGAVIKFISFEPLLGPLEDIDFSGIDWSIVGGESGPKARPIKEEWVKGIRDQCTNAGVPFFFKQWGGTNKKKAGRLLEGKTWSQMPAYSPA